MPTRKNARRMETVCSMLTEQEKDRVICGVLHAKTANIDWEAAALDYGAANAASFKRMYYMSLSKLRDIHSTAVKTEADTYESQHGYEVSTPNQESLVVRLPALSTLNLPDPAPVFTSSRNLRSGKRKVSSLHAAEHPDDLGEDVSDFEDFITPAPRRGTQSSPKKYRKNASVTVQPRAKTTARSHQTKSNGKNNMGRKNKNSVINSFFTNDPNHDEHYLTNDANLTDRDAEGSPDPEASSHGFDMYLAGTTEPDQYYKSEFHSPSVGVGAYQSYSQNHPQGFRNANQAPAAKNRHNLGATLNQSLEGRPSPLATRTPTKPSGKRCAPRRGGHRSYTSTRTGNQGPETPANATSSRRVNTHDVNRYSQHSSDIYNSVNSSYNDAAMASMDASQRPPNYLGLPPFGNNYNNTAFGSMQQSSNYDNHQNFMNAYNLGQGAQAQQTSVPTANMLSSPLAYCTSPSQADVTSPDIASTQDLFYSPTGIRRDNIRDQQHAVKMDVQQQIRDQQHRNMQLGLQYHNDGSAGVAFLPQSTAYSTEQAYGQVSGEQSNMEQANKESQINNDDFGTTIGADFGHHDLGMNNFNAMDPFGHDQISGLVQYQLGPIDSYDQVNAMAY